MEQKTELVIKDMDKADAITVAETAVRLLDSKKARNIRMYHVSEQTVVADYYVICEGNVRTQIHAMADELEVKFTEAGLQPAHIDGRDSDSWVLLDYGSVMVHIMVRDTREFYNIEKLWDSSCEIDISNLVQPD